MDRFALLDELRILAKNGLEYTEDPHDRERYERVLELTSEWYGRSVDIDPDEVRTRFGAEVGHVTPKVSADAAVFDESDRILLQLRSDDRTWSLPGGYTDPNESPEETAVRETREETGLVVEPRELVGVYTRKPGEYGPHCLVVHLYLCVPIDGELTVSEEGEELRYWEIGDVPDWHKNHHRLAGDANEVGLRSEQPRGAE